MRREKSKGVHITIYDCRAKYKSHCPVKHAMEQFFFMGFVCKILCCLTRLNENT